MRVLLLDHDGREDIVGIDADHVGVAQQVDLVREQEAQRRLRQRIKILRRELAVAHHDRRAVGDELDRRRIVIFEAHACRASADRPGPASCCRPGRPARNRRPSVLHAGEIGADAIGQRALLGVETAAGLSLLPMIGSLLDGGWPRPARSESEPACVAAPERRAAAEPDRFSACGAGAGNRNRLRHARDTPRARMPSPSHAAARKADWFRIICSVPAFLVRLSGGLWRIRDCAAILSDFDNRPSAASKGRALFLRNEDFALSGMVGLADDAFLFHPLHQRGSAIIADLQPALDVARGGLAVAFDDRDRLPVEVVAVAAAHVGGVEHRAVLVFLVARA